MREVPSLPMSLKTILIGLLCFLLGLLAGSGGFYFYSSKILIPKYKAQMMEEIFSNQGAEWGDFFKKLEEETSQTEHANPFEGSGGISGEDYVNPFDVVE